MKEVSVWVAWGLEVFCRPRTIRRAVSCVKDSLSGACRTPAEPATTCTHQCSVSVMLTEAIRRHMCLFTHNRVPRSAGAA